MTRQIAGTRTHCLCTSLHAALIATPIHILSSGVTGISISINNSRQRLHNERYLWSLEPESCVRHTNSLLWLNEGCTQKIQSNKAVEQTVRSKRFSCEIRISQNVTLSLVSHCTNRLFSMKIYYRKEKTK